MEPKLSHTANVPQPGMPDQFGITQLLQQENIDWELIKKKFLVSPEQFEDLLFRVHYKRKKPLTVSERSNVLNFLFIGYSLTGDIRYFNEFLWFYKENEVDKPMMDVCIEMFNTHLDAKGQHKMIDRLRNHPADLEGYDLSKIEYRSTSPLRICLIGFPPFFGNMIRQLKKEGHYVEQFFLPYHPNKHINRFLKFGLPVKALSLFAGNSYYYRTLKFDQRDERIGKILREGNFDIGFHKLNFIIRENIFGAFRLGLLNDHWGYLPMLRGKSTIAWSVLLNVPVTPTIHFINQGIDAGPIVGYYPCNYQGARTVKEIREILRKKMPQRAVAAIKYAASSFISKENTKEAGVTFYEIHPWLNEHIASRILKLNS